MVANSTIKVTTGLRLPVTTHSSQREPDKGRTVCVQTYWYRGHYQPYQGDVINFINASAMGN